MSYTYFHVLTEAVPDDATIAAAVTETLSHLRVRGTGELLVVPVCPREDLTILEVSYDRGLSFETQGKAPKIGVPAGFEFECPFLFRLAAAMAARSGPAVGAFVTDQTQGFAVVRIGSTVHGARCDTPAFFGSLKYFVCTDGKETRVPDASAQAAEVLASTVRENFERPLDYLQWYVGWFDGWFAENYSTVSYPRPLRILSENGVMSQPTNFDPQEMWKDYFP